MLSSLPASAREFMTLSWGQIEPFYQELADAKLSPYNVDGWLADWTRLAELVSETQQRLYVATTVNTEDKDAEQQLFHFLDHVYPHVESSEQSLRTMLLASALEPHGFEVPLRNMRAQSALFREANLPLLTEEHKLETEYDKVIGAQTVAWDGREVTVTQLRPHYQDTNRSVREQAWRVAIGRQLADREALNALWRRYLSLRKQLASNAGFGDYRSYRWQQLLRFDYTPDDCKRFHEAIERTVVPAAERLFERRRLRLGVSVLRPWDLDVDPLGLPPLRPYSGVSELENGVAGIFSRVDPQLGDYYAMMRREELLDLDNRKGKAPGGYCTAFAVAKRPFIFMNSVGLHDDVQTLLHEGGHAFHVFESAHLAYIQQMDIGMEFAEVASMSMELLAAPYLARREGGFYTDRDAARALIEHLESVITFWPYMAVVDAFQHWVYENEAVATQPDECDARWGELWHRFMRGVDWGGLEQEMITGWHRKLHIFQVPFYYVEYGMAQLGAVQVWRNSLRNQPEAVRQYRNALSLGGTLPLPQLYAAAGATFNFDVSALGEAVTLVEDTLQQLETAAGR